MHNSPSCPACTSLSSSSTINIPVFLIGLPISILSLFVNSLTADHTVVSVGPYILYIRAFVLSLIILKSLIDNFSPPSIMVLTFFKHDNSSSKLTNICIVDGVI